MKFMIFVKATADSEAGRMPDRGQLETMIAFNERLADDGILLAAEGLRASSKGTRIRFDGGRATVTDGPFAETKELIAGFWLVQGRSRAEIVERFSHVPFERGEAIEIREVIEAEDLGDAFTPDMCERVDRITLDDLPKP